MCWFRLDFTHCWNLKLSATSSLEVNLDERFPSKEVNMQEKYFHYYDAGKMSISYKRYLLRELSIKPELRAI